MDSLQAEKKSYSTTEVAKICDVHFTTVYHWIDKKLLATRKTPGGHNRILETDLVEFLHKYDYPVPELLRGKRSKKILIVEDDTAQRKLLRRLISKSFPGYEIFEADNGFEAGFMARDLKPALVILDLLLPGMHGARICRVIRQTADLKNTKILSITAYRVEKAKRVLLKAGANVFLEKPYKNLDLVRAVGELLGTPIPASD